MAGRRRGGLDLLALRLEALHGGRRIRFRLPLLLGCCLLRLLELLLQLSSPLFGLLRPSGMLYQHEFFATNVCMITG